MRRITGFLTVTALVLGVTRGMAHEATHAHDMGHMTMAGVQKTVTGEVVDLGCYLGHGARGEKHISCATKCINEGMPMGLLTSNGTVYLLTLNHDDSSPYNDLKTRAGKMVSVTGTVMARGGMKAIDVTAAKPI
jgi:hypothetical protein